MVIVLMPQAQFKIDGVHSGAITFNNAYKFPTADGSANPLQKMVAVHLHL